MFSSQMTPRELWTRVCGSALPLASILILALITSNSPASAAISGVDITQPTALHPAYVSPGASIAINGSANVGDHQSDELLVTVNLNPDGANTPYYATVVFEANGTQLWQAIYPDQFTVNPDGSGGPVPNLTDGDTCSIDATDTEAYAIICTDERVWSNPHQAGEPGGGFGVTPDACAGCHRAHTAKGTRLLAMGSTIDQFCYSCHESGTGAYTDVANGIYLGGGNTPGPWGEGTTNAGLRGGGIKNAKMDPSLSGTPIMSGATSTHTVNNTTLGTMWGSGAFSSSNDPGASLSLGCTNCHNPHGNASYRILRPWPIGGYNKDLQTAVDKSVIVPDESSTIYTVSYNTTTYHRNSSYTPQYLEEWCAQCHTRYMANGGSGHIHSTDSIFSYRHNSSGTFLSCTRCHVAHGSSASMDNYSDTVAWPDGSIGPQDNARSSLLHSNNRGVCARCHVDDTGQVFMHGDGEGGGSSGGGSGCDASGCHGYSGTHATHTVSNSKGPDPLLDCDDCHDTDNYPLFIGGKNLNDTDACDNCHSPGGTYDGVNDPIIGAKVNWDDGVYNSPILKAGKEKWCAGCHDEEGANSQADALGISAPEVIGDEGQVTSYGIGYGFYKTGHGVPGTQTFPATMRVGANLGCLDCHDANKKHIDGDPRTYQALDAYLDYTPESGAYQEGYRIRNVTPGYAGQFPLHMPRTGHVYPPEFREDSEFALCFECHNRNNLFNGGNPSTGAGAGTEFRAISNGDGAGNPAPTIGSWYSMHDVHTWGANGPWGPETPQYDSDFNGVADSRMSCTACHNVHGSSSPAMIRDGQLVGATGLGFQYTPAGSNLSSSDGGALVNGAGQGTVGSNGICNMCHAQSITYDRPPLNPSTLSMTGMNPSNGSTGIDLGSNLTFTLSDGDNGVDWTAFSIALTGDKGYSQTYTDVDTAVVSKTGDQYSYNVTIDPDADFGTTEIISITVNVDNLGSPTQSLIPPAWSFTTASGGSSNIMTLHPSGVVTGQDGGFAIQNGTWENALDSNDGDASYAHKCCTSPGFSFTADIDDPSGLGSATINDVTIYVYAKYLDGPWPNPTAISSNVNVGYNTGGSTVWSGVFTTDSSGDYNLITYNLGSLSVLDISNLQVSVERSTSGSLMLRVTEVYVEIDYTP